MKISWHHFACTCILVGWEVSNPRKRLVGKLRSIIKDNVIQRFVRTPLNLSFCCTGRVLPSHLYLPLSILKYKCMQSDITNASFCYSAKLKKHKHTTSRLKQIFILTYMCYSPKMYKASLNTWINYKRL